MNYLGHAAVASWFSTEPTFLLGSMLPDFAGFLRLSLPQARDPMLGAGVAMHHDTDRVFHATTTFRKLNRAAAQALGEARVPRGPARAVAHVGVEMLIEVAMAEHPSTLATFHAALCALDPVLLRQTLLLEESRYARLLQTAAAVRARGSGLWAPDPNVISSRIARTFASRPRLSIGLESLPSVSH